MELIKEGIKVKEASYITGIPVSSIYYKASHPPEDEQLIHHIQEIAFKHTFYGYRRIHQALQRYGVTVNHKKVYKLYRILNLQRHKLRRNSKNIMPATPLTEAEYKNHSGPWISSLTASMTAEG